MGMKKSRKHLLLLSLLLSMSAKADIYSDVANIASGIADMSGYENAMLNNQVNNVIPKLNNIDTLNTQISNWTQQQLGISQEEWNAMRKMYKMGQHIDGSVPAELWSSEDWNEALMMTSGGNSSRYNELKTAYADKNPTVSANTTASAINVGQLSEDTYTQKAAVANTALASSQYTYEDVSPRVKTFDQLKAWIDDESVNQNEKAAIDLNTRALIEIGYIQNEALRLQSIQTQVAAIKAQEEINSETADQKFFQQH